MDLNVNQCVSVIAGRHRKTPTMLTKSLLGLVQGDWLIQAKPDIEARMAQYEEGHIEFAILSLVQDPLHGMISALAENIKAINVLSARLDVVKPGWKGPYDLPTNSEVAGTDGLISEPNLAYGLTQEMLDRAALYQTVNDLCYKSVASDILRYRDQLITIQTDIRMSIREEMQSNQSDEERAAARACDYGARMQNFVRQIRLKQRSFHNECSRT